MPRCQIHDLRRLLWLHTRSTTTALATYTNALSAGPKHSAVLSTKGHLLHIDGYESHASSTQIARPFYLAKSMMIAARFVRKGSKACTFTHVRPDVPGNGGIGLIEPRGLFARNREKTFLLQTFKCEKWGLISVTAGLRGLFPLQEQIKIACLFVVPNTLNSFRL